MYVQCPPVPIRSSASLLYNNFDVLPSKNQSEVMFGVVHKSLVWLFNPQNVRAQEARGDASAAYKKVICKGESVHSSSIILQAKWCALPQRTLLVITSIKGAQMFESDGSIMVFWQTLSPSPIPGEAQYARGITSVGDHYICIGVADGTILVFDVPERGTGVKLQETLSAHTSSISDLHASNNMMVSSDENGDLVTWRAAGHFQKLHYIDGCGFPCASVRLWKSLIIASYGSGHVRVFNAETGTIKVEISAHAKWINAIDIADQAGLLLTSSEDSYVRVWNLKNFTLEFQESVGNIQISGARFLDMNGGSFGITGYDCTDVVIYEKS